MRFRLCNSLETELGLQEGQVLKRLTGLVGGHGLELILQESLESHLGSGSSLGGLHLLLADPGLAIERLAGKSVSGRDDVVEVHILDERLHSLSLGCLSLRHSLSDGQRGLLDTHNQGVTERSGLSALIENLHDDGLLSSLTSLSEHDDSSRLDAKE